MDIKKLIEEMKKREKELTFENEFIGRAVLTFANRNNSARGNMNSQQTTQRVLISNHEKPKIATSYENMFGNNSKEYTEVDNGNFIIIDKIIKFKDYPESPYILVVKDIDTGLCDIIERVEYKPLPEDNCLTMDNKVIDSYRVGDTIGEGTVLNKPVSYDDSMNWMGGVNAVTHYNNDTRTSEDAILIRKSFADKLFSPKLTTIRVPLNDNDIFINIMGDVNNYKPFPEIGEEVKNGKICAVRRRNKETYPYYFTKSNMSVTSSMGDTIYYPKSSKAKLVDIRIFCNKKIEEIKDGEYNEQLIRYLKNELDYYRRIQESLQREVDGGMRYTYRFAELLSRVNAILSEDIGFSGSKGNVFSNMEIEFVIAEEHPLTVGSKLVARHGNKGVVSCIVDDEDMYFAHDSKGNRIYVDLVMNDLGKVNRINAGQDWEVSLSYFTWYVQDMYIDREPDVYKKKQILLEYLRDVYEYIPDKSYIQTVIKVLHSCELENKLPEFFKSISENRGIGLIIPPFFNGLSIMELYRIRTKWKIKRKDTYVKFGGRIIKTTYPAQLGIEYFYKLKHTSDKKFSARCSDKVDNKDLPNSSKDNKKKSALFSRTATRPGGLGYYNQQICDVPEAWKRHNFYNNSSPRARKAWGRLLAEEPYKYMEPDYEYPTIDKNCVNRNVEIIDVKLASLGIYNKKVDIETNEEIFTYFDSVKDFEENINETYGVEFPNEDEITSSLGAELMALDEDDLRKIRESFGNI